MFFLFRCVFWLGLVFHHLPWADGARPADDARALAAGAVAATSRLAGTQARDACLAAPGACMGAAGVAIAVSRSSLTRADARPEWRDPRARHARADLRATRVR
jgi:hypothetical protein